MNWKEEARHRPQTGHEVNRRIAALPARPLYWPSLSEVTFWIGLVQLACTPQGSPHAAAPRRVCPLPERRVKLHTEPEPAAERREPQGGGPREATDPARHGGGDGSVGAVTRRGGDQPAVAPEDAGH